MEKKKKEKGTIPDVVRKEKEPGEVEQNGGKEEDGVSPGEALTAALDGDEGEQ